MTPEERRESLLKQLKEASEIVASWDKDKQETARRAVNVYNKAGECLSDGKQNVRRDEEEWLY